MSFKTSEMTGQIAFLQRSKTFSDEARSGGGSFAGLPRKFVLPSEFEIENLAPQFRRPVVDYFKQHRIVWHRANAHLLSSQVCCINFLEAFAGRPDCLKSLLQPHLGQIAEMLPPEPETNPRRYVAYEYIGKCDYLNEAKPGVIRTRGANCTSTDAAVRLRRPNGMIEIHLIEWKYTESYARPRSSDPRNIVRRNRYGAITFAPDGPVRRERGLEFDDYMTDPIYQLFRQQILAFQIERAREAGATRVGVLHISPKANISLKRILVPAFQHFGEDVFRIWQSMLYQPDRFSLVTAGSLFGKFDASAVNDADLLAWQDYIGDRYPSVLHD